MQAYHSLFPHKVTLRSNPQIQKLSIKRIAPRELAFDLDETINTYHFKTLAKFLSRPAKFRNPPLKMLQKHASLIKNANALTISPKDALSYLKNISKKFTRLHKLSICNEDNSFAPMKFKSKLHPIRSLKLFHHDHELCKDFMACARYATSIKVRKSSLNLDELKKFKHLKSLYLILKAKYVNFEEDGEKFVYDLAKVINKNIPTLRTVTLDHEIDPENHPYVPLLLNNALEGRVQVNLVADLVDISNYRNPDNSVERIFNEISLSGIHNINVNYAGVMKTVKKYGRWFYVPICMRKELYTKLLKTMQNNNFGSKKIEATVHSSNLNTELKETLLEATKPGSRVKIPKMTLIYSLDMIEEDTLKSLLDLYNEAIPSYDIIVTSSGNLTHHQCEMLEAHYSQVLAKIKLFNTRFSLTITARDYKSLISLIQITIPRKNLFLLNSLTIRIIDPVTKSNLKSLPKLVNKSLPCTNVSKLSLCIYQEETVASEEIYNLMDSILLKNSKLKKLSLLHQNLEDYEDVICEAFDKLRKDRCLIDLKYGIDKEKNLIYE